LVKKYTFENQCCTTTPMQFKPGLFLLLFFLLINAPAWAQVCTGSLGDPVFTFDFGSGNDRKFPVTGYQFVGGSCPNDGQYSLSKTETGCHDDTWHRVLQDHTGNDGFMMVVNADAVAGKEFFSKTTTIDGTNIGALCENTTYEFSAYILNLIKAGQPGFIEPRITFTIETLTGEVIGTPYTVDIPPTSDPNGWVKYGTFFKTRDGVTAVVIRMVNNAPGGNGNDLLLDDIAFRACSPLIQAGFSGDVNITENNVCEGNAASYTITSTPPSGYENPRSQWQQNINGTGWSDITGEENASLGRDFPASTAKGTYQYRIGVAEGGNITSQSCRVYSNPVTISITSYPNPPPFLPTPVCEGEPLTLTASGGAMYKWTGPNLPETSQNPLIISNVTIANAGRYYVDVISAAGCVTPQYVDVIVNAKPVIAINSVMPVCRGDGRQLTALVDDESLYTYSWLPAAGLSNGSVFNPVATPDVSTNYTVTVTNKITKCTSTAQVQVDVLDLPVANAGGDKKIFEGQSVKLDGSATGDIATYSWSPPDYLDDPTSATPVATPPHDMPYKLTVTSANGCGIDVDDVFVRVYQKIIIPSAFTPNNDGVNDIWNIEALETYPDGMITVFTRNGKQVFQSRGYGKPWDGKLNGSLLPTGTYYYVIDLKNGTPKLSGWVLLMR
jgi:gliding motility-associated-like protein